MNSLWMYDFVIFYHGAQAILRGVSIYTVADFNGPFPLAVLFLPFAPLPLPLAYALFIVLNLALLWKVCGRRAGWALFSFPVLFGLFTGQVDLFLALLLPLGSPWLLGLAIVKPQVGWLVLPALLSRLKMRDLLKSAAGGAAFLALCFAIRPTWLSEWLAAQPGAQAYSNHAANLYWLIPAARPDLRVTVMLIGAGLAFIAGFFIKNRADSWAALQLFQPLTNIYSPSALAEWIGPLECALSWVALAFDSHIHDGMPLFVIPLAILFRRHLLPRWRARRDGSTIAEACQIPTEPNFPSPGTR